MNWGLKWVFLLLFYLVSCGIIVKKKEEMSLGVFFILSNWLFNSIFLLVNWLINLRDFFLMFI